MKASHVYVSLILAPAVLSAVAMMPGCSTAPPDNQARQDLTNESKTAITEMNRADPTLSHFIERGYAYAVFPNVGKGAVGVGGAYGRGEVYQGGQLIGYADLSQGSIGLQLGGQTYSELIVFESAYALRNFEDNKMEFTANVSAVALKEGAAETAKFEHGIVVFVQPKGGAMFEASVGGQQFTFQPIAR
jgi:lipid-binding SYLF domain-containing protein